LIKNAGHREKCRECATPRQKIPVVRLNPEEHSQRIVFGNNSTTPQQQQPFSVSVPSSTTTTSAPTFSWGQTTPTKAETPKKDGFAVPTGLPSFGGFGASTTTTTNNASTPKPSISTGVSPVAASSSKSWMPSGLNTGNLFSFGSSPKPSLSNASSVDDLSIVDDKFSGVTSAFANATFSFTFESTKSQTPKTPSPTKNKWKTATSPTSPDYNPEDGEPNIEFSPLVTLSQLNHTSTGEENEVCLFVNRCKMFRYDATQWKERGLGELKILSNTLTGHRRLVMRRDQIHKLCANHAIVPGMEIKAMKGSTKAFVWQAYGDISDELSKDMMLAARFKDETIANEFVAAITEGFDEDQGAMLGSGETSGKDSGGKVIVISDDENTSNDTSSTTTHQRSSLQHEDDDDDELSITYELTCPKELQLKARKLLLPSSFYNEPTIRLSQRPSKTQALSSSMVDSSTMTSQVASSPTRDLVLTYEKEGSTGDRNKAKQLLLPKSFFNADGETKERNQTIALDNSDDSDSTDNYGVRNAGTSSSRTADLFTSSIRKYDSSGYGKILFQENADVFKYTTLARDWVESRDSMRVLICRTVASATPNNENCVILFVRDHDNNVCIERTVDRKIRAQFRIDGQPTMIDVQFCDPFKSTEQMALKFESTPQAESFLTTFNECSVDGVNTDDVVSPRDENKISGNGLPTIFGGSTSAGSTGLSFATLASNQESGFSSNAGQQFSGAGKSLFGGGNGGDEGGDEGGNDVYVEPIVQLS